MGRVLVVDDDSQFADLICHDLEEHGHRAEFALSVAEAKAAIRNRVALLLSDFDVLVLDWALGDGTGMDVLDAYTGTGKVVLLSGNDRTREMRGRERVPDVVFNKADLPEALDAIAALAAAS